MTGKNIRAAFDFDTFMVAMLIVAIVMGAILAFDARGTGRALVFIGQILICAFALALKLRKILRGPRITVIDHRKF